MNDTPTGPWLLPTEAHTEAAARLLAQHLAPGDVLGLEGDLGAGKTCFTRALMKGLYLHSGTTPPPDLRVTSPTYALVNLYPAPEPFGEVAHFDLYRLNDLDDLESTGYWDLLEEAPLAIVEWMGHIEEAWPAKAWALRLEHCEGGRLLHVGLRSTDNDQRLRFGQACRGWEARFS